MGFSDGQFALGWHIGLSMGVGRERSFKMLWQVSLGPGREASCDNVISLVIKCSNMLVITLDEVHCAVVPHGDRLVITKYILQGCP